MFILGYSHIDHLEKNFTGCKTKQQYQFQHECHLLKQTRTRRNRNVNIVLRDVFRNDSSYHVIEMNECGCQMSLFKQKVNKLCILRFFSLSLPVLKREFTVHKCTVEPLNS